VVEKSTIHHNTGYGVHVYNGYAGQRADNNIVRNNQIFDNGYTGYSAGIILGSGDGNTAYNNLVWNNEAGIQIAYSNPSNTAVYNNTVYANSTYGIYVHGDSSNAIIKNNLFYANGRPEIQNNGVGTVLDHNLTGTDPKFVNAAAWDFHLQLGSPAIDAGIAVSLVTTDIVGTPRPQGGGVDIGAFEFADPSP
jgi:parallel beta-helix repeat protein